MKRGYLALEELPLVAIDNNLAIENPLGFDMLDEKGVSVTMDRLDEIGQSLQISVGDGQESIAALESMAHYLQKNGSTTLGKTGVAFANIAIEQLCVKAKLSLEALPINTTAFVEDPESAVSSGISEIKKMQADVITKMSGDLSNMLVTLTQKRELFNKAIQHLYHRIDEVQEAIDCFPKEKKEVTLRGFLVVAPTWKEFFYGSGTTQGGGTVVADVEFLMTEHTHLFKRLIKRQLDWIQQHKDNVLATKDGFANYSFNPIEYNISGTERSVNNDQSLQHYISSSVLPGNYCFNCITSGTIKTGFDAAQALLQSKAFLSENQPVEMDKRIHYLRVVDIEARLAELKHGLSKLKHWCDSAYCELWKEAFFDETMISFLLKTEAGSLNERGLSMVAQGILSLLDNASKDIGQYALLTFSTLLEYVECCMSAWVSEGNKNA